MKWDDLPDDLIKYILYLRKFETCKNYASSKIIATWKCYKMRVLINRYLLVRFYKDFRIYNPTFQIFYKKARL